ncbi:aminopeptidase [Microbacterium sp. G2-8]|uniref:aminopeptidase n=1 Tax=Microbacterium sp. G2-8 TaxID=2842454 RepID=UPI001C89C453|nr:aminopeptidase [Microbacterium sp. G2-8]
MTDPRWAELARQLCDAHGVANGTKVGVFRTDSSTTPGVLALVEEVYRRGGLPQVVDSDERFDRAAVAAASADVLATPAPLELWSMEWADVHVSYRGMVAPAADPVDEARLATQRGAKGAISTARWQQTSWALVRVPTPEWASLIGLPYETLLDEFFAGTLADWPRLRRDWDALCGELGTAREVRIMSRDTDLRLGTAGRTWVSFAGEANLPDGEIATAPVDDRVDGHIAFPGTFWFAGAAVEDLRLEFRDGEATDVQAARGGEFARRLLDTDAGARRVGELGVGTNPRMQSMTGDLLIDEKILGTVHIALGRAYPECGGVNRSSLHWDIVKDLREPGASLMVDGRELIRDGKVLEPLLLP